MTRKLIATAVVPFFLASAAVAQTGGVMGEDWSQEATSAFFADDGAMTLLDEAEIRTNWAELTQEDRTAVLNSCATMETAVVPDVGGSETGTPDTNAATFGEPATGTDAPVENDSAVTTGQSSDAGLPANNASTFGTAATGTDGTAGTVPGTVESGSSAEGTGQSNASSFGDAATGVGIAQVTSDTWEELCTMVVEF